MCEVQLEKYSVKYRVPLRKSIMDEVLEAAIADMDECDGVMDSYVDDFDGDLYVVLDPEVFCCARDMEAYLAEKVLEWKLQE